MKYMMTTFIVGIFMAYASTGYAKSSSLQSIGIEKDPHSISQLLFITTYDWQSVDGIAQRYERQNANSMWHKVGDAFPIVVGKEGLAWDPLLQKTLKLSGPYKQEGDSRSPAGVFTLNPAFGFSVNNATKLPYLQLQQDTICIDDPQSTHYNRIIPDQTKIANRDWKSSELMRTIDVYEQGIVVNYNQAATKNHGSCVFLHIWRGKGKGTAGCTAMPLTHMNMLQQWLTIKKSPLLIQTTRTELPKLQTLLAELRFRLDLREMITKADH